MIVIIAFITSEKYIDVIIHDSLGCRGDGGGYGDTCLSIHGSFDRHDRCLYHCGGGFDTDVDDATNHTDFDDGRYLGVLADRSAAAVSRGVTRSAAARYLSWGREHHFLSY